MFFSLSNKDLLLILQGCRSRPENSAPAPPKNLSSGNPGFNTGIQLMFNGSRSF